MKLDAIAESFPEWLALRFNSVPLPLLHGQMFPVISKAVLVAADRLIFSAVAKGKSTPDAVAAECRLAVAPTAQLMQVLAALGYLSSGTSGYALTPMTRKWALFGSDSDLSDLLVYNNRVVWKWLEHLDTYLETGVGVDYHRVFGDEEWRLYQKAMLAVARSEVATFARKCPLPKGARYMLDIGGAHGLHVKALQQRYPQLRARILDLPGAWNAVEDQESATIERSAGNILDTILPASAFDLVLMSSLAHHFSQAENRAIALKVADSLKPGGLYVVNEFVSPGDAAVPGGLVGASSNLFFGLTSTSGTWTVAETQAWQTAAGLKPFKVIGYTAIPGRFQIVARKESDTSR